jgi:hypothetical protein
MHIVHNARITLLATALNSLALAVMAIEIPPPGVGSNTWLKQCGRGARAAEGGRQRVAAPCSTRCGVID